MKKGLITLFLIVLLSFSLSSKAAALEIGVITDDTSIVDDLKALDINEDDYFILEDSEYNFKNYFEWFVIAVAENRISATSIHVYIYIYNPITIDSVDVSIDMTINEKRVQGYFNENSNSQFSLCGKSEEHNILKLCYIDQTDYNAERNYEIVIEDLKNEVSSKKFTAQLITKEDEKRLVTNYNFDSMLFIEKDILLTLRFEDWNTNSWWQSICHEFNFFKDDEEVLMFFYNFNASKTIDEIVEVELNYDHYVNTSTAYYDPSTGTRLRTLNSSNSNVVNDAIRIKRPGVQEQSVYGVECSFNAFTTPASNRIKEFGNAIEISSSLFNYDHSILVDINRSVELTSTLKWVPKKEVFPLVDDSSLTAVLEKKISEYMITDLKMTRLTYKAEGKTFNSYVLDDVDDPVFVDPDNTNILWWQQILETFRIVGAWVLELFNLSAPSFVQTIVGAVVCFIGVLLIPAIIRLLINLISSLINIIF